MSKFKCPHCHSENVDLCKAVVEPGRYCLECLDCQQYSVVSGNEDEKKEEGEG